MADENDRQPAQAPARVALAHGHAALGGDAIIMRPAGRAEFQVAVELAVANPVQHLFVSLGGKLLRGGQFHAASDGDQQEQVHRHRPVLAGQGV